MGDHKPVYIVCIVAAAVMFVVTVIFNALSGGIGVQAGVFLNGTGDVSDKFRTEITPAGWTFSIWGFIYAYQAIFLVYAFSTICRRGPNKGYIYYDPVINPPAIYIIYVFNMAINTSWLFAWDRQQMIAALILIALLPFSLYICLVLSMRAVVKYSPELVAAGNRYEPWLVRGIVHNGLAIYATWVTIATLLNFNIVLVYNAGVSSETASTVALGILTFEILLYWTLDNIVLDRYTRYTYTPYIVVIVALVGSLTGNWNPGARNFVFTAVLLGIGCALTLIKLVLSIWRHFYRPISSVVPEN